MRSTVKVLVVDDSALTRQMLTRALSLDPGIEVIGTAKTGVDAIEKSFTLRPEVVTLDIEMPELTGIEALPHIIKSTPARVVMLSAVDDPDTTYHALSLGATDFIVKPRGGFASSLSELSEAVIKKIKTAYRVRPEHRFAVRDIVGGESSHHGTSARTVSGREVEYVVALAASTGGPPALEAVFSGLDSSLPAAYLIVQHLPAGFTESLARRLGRTTDIPVLPAESGMALQAGSAYVAPYGSHMLVEGRKTARVMLDDAPSMHGVRPAADPMMESVARHFAERAIGVVLTGMGSDGARGLQAIKDAGGETIAQDEDTSVVWGMPGASARSGAANHVVPLGRVSAEIRRAARGVTGA